MANLNFPQRTYEMVYRAITPQKRLTTSFAYNKVKAVDEFGVGELVRDHSANAASQASSNASTTARETRRNISKTETCFVSKRPSYTLERVHWINAVRKNPSLKKEIETFLKELSIVHRSFNLNDTSNLTNLDRMLHVSLDKYGFFAVTASQTTLRLLINLMRNENRVWQERFDQGLMHHRHFDLFRTPIVDAQYELVVLHPEHFLPKGSNLTFFTCMDGNVSGKSYVIGEDRTLRESPGTLDSPRLPAFAFDADRPGGLPLNVFLVVLNAQIKFRRYKRMTSVQALPQDVQELIDLTMELVDLIYWIPQEVTSSYFYRRTGGAMDVNHQAQHVEDVEMGVGTSDEQADSNHDITPGPRHHGVVERAGANASLEERREYGQYLMSGRDFELDSDDQDLLEELGIAPNFLEVPIVPDTDIDSTHVVKKVHRWQEGLQIEV